jgi:glycolate oxidase FAD binding subunit
MREQSDEYFLGAQRAIEASTATRLWRLSLPQTAAPLALPGEQLIEWGGAQRWLCSGAPAGQVREAASAAGGHATIFRAHDKSPGVFTPLRPPLDRIQRALMRSFDPQGIFDAGRLYPGP